MKANILFYLFLGIAYGIARTLIFLYGDSKEIYLTFAILIGLMFVSCFYWDKKNHISDGKIITTCLTTGIFLSFSTILFTTLFLGCTRTFQKGTLNMTEFMSTTLALVPTNVGLGLVSLVQSLMCFWIAGLLYILFKRIIN